MARGSGETLEWALEGMDCPSCAGKVEAAIARLPGVSDLAVNALTARLALRLDPDGATPAQVEAATAALGHPARRLGGAPHDQHDQHDAADAHDHDDPADAGKPWWKTAKARLVAVLGGLVGAAWGLSQVFPEAATPLYLAATLAALVPFGRRAVALARAGQPFSIETLMCVAALGAVVIGAAAEAALVVFLFALGELLEGVAAGRARAGIQALAELMPRSARRERPDGTIEEIDAARLATGDVVRVRPGERVPCDGTILEGNSALDESPVTGESMPIPRGPGAPVLAGSVNSEAELRIRAERVGADGTLARIARLVAEATASRSPAERFVQRFSRWWTPAAMAASALTILVPPLLFGGAWDTWVYRGLALLLVACPCALVISVPAAVASGLAAGARRGLLVKGGAALEALGAARTMAFDKTGTLTEGRPKVTDLIAAPGVDETDALRLAASVEAGSAHPLARAIVEAAEARGIAPPPATDARAVPGRAAEALVEGRRVAVGSPRHATESGTGLGALVDRATALETEGKTVVAVLAGGAVIALLAIRDEPRADAAAGVAALRRLGVSAVMLTGDNPRTAAAIAAGFGMEAKAGLLPEDKLREIAALGAAPGGIVMVGDGINDAPALAAATVGVAMGGGTAAALEAADAALLRDRVMGAAELVSLSRATLRNVRQNVGVALGLKAIFLVTTLAGVTGLWPAILADTGATVLVTINALRLLRWTPPASLAAAP